jgi:hypothetical protein
MKAQKFTGLPDKAGMFLTKSLQSIHAELTVFNPSMSIDDLHLSKC